MVNDIYPENSISDFILLAKAIYIYQISIMVIVKKTLFMICFDDKNLYLNYKEIAFTWREISVKQYK